MAGRQGATTLEERSALPPRVAGSLIRGGILLRRRAYAVGRLGAGPGRQHIDLTQLRDDLFPLAVRLGHKQSPSGGYVPSFMVDQFNGSG